MRENLRGAPAPAMDEAAAQALVAGLRERLAGLHGVELANAQRVSRRENELLIVTIPDPLDAWRGGVSFALVYRDGTLDVREPVYSNQRGPAFTTADELVALIAACVVEMERSHAKAQRANKVRGLQAQAIVGAARKLAEDEGFEFFASTDTRKLNLYIAVGADDLLELHIPFARFQELLPRLKQAVLALRDLHKTGLRFRLRKRSTLRERDIQFTNRKK